MAGHGMAGHGRAGHGGAWRGMAGHGGAWRGMAGHGGAWRGMAGHDGACRGMAGHGGAWRGIKWRGFAWHGMACQGRLHARATEQLPTVEQALEKQSVQVSTARRSAVRRLRILFVHQHAGAGAGTLLPQGLNVRGLGTKRHSGSRRRTWTGQGVRGPSTGPSPPPPPPTHTLQTAPPHTHKRG
jgi:hypothetical protein